MERVLKKLIWASVFPCLVLLSCGAYAYEIATHVEISEAAYKSSVLNNSDFLKVLNISAAHVFDRNRADPTPPKLNDGTALGWIREGTVSEDDTNRPANHFYNPLTGKGLTIIGYPSPDWALVSGLGARR